MKRGMMKMIDEARADAPFEKGGIPLDLDASDLDKK